MIIKTQLFCPAIHCTLWCLLAATSHADTNSITILTQPSAQTVNQGGAAAYSVAALGTPPLTYQWRFNMQGLLGATSSNLTITNVQATNIGFFDVVVSNQDGFVVSSPAALHVTGVFPERLALGLGAVPLGFVQNSGQSDPAVAFQASSLGAGTVFLMTDGHIQLALSGYDSLPACVRQIQYLGANPSPTVQALNPTVGSTTYLIGNNPGPWVTNLPDFAAIEYDQLYSGIAVSYSGTGRWLKS